MGIIMLVADQLQYDQYNSRKDFVYRVNSIRIDEKLQALDHLPPMSDLTDGSSRGSSKSIRVSISLLFGCIAASVMAGSNSRTRT